MSHMKAEKDFHALSTPRLGATMTCNLCNDYHKRNHDTSRTPPKVAEPGTDKLRKELQDCMAEQQVLAEDRLKYHQFAQKKQEMAASAERMLETSADELRVVKEELNLKSDDADQFEEELRVMHPEWAEWQVEYKEEVGKENTDIRCEAFSEMNTAELE